MKENTILIVDDEPNILNYLRRVLSEESWEVMTAQDQQTALNILGKEKVKVILSDQHMPGVSGTEFLAKMKHVRPQAIRILFTGGMQESETVATMEQGLIYCILNKPCKDTDLKMTLGRAIEKYDLETENRELNKNLKNMDLEIQQLKSQIKKITETLNTFNETVPKEFKGILIAMQTTVNALRQNSCGVLTPDQRDSVDKLQSATQRLSRMADEKLDFTKTNIASIFHAAFNFQTKSAAKTILLIDDDKNLLNMLQTQLQEQGHSVITAGNGVEGLEKLNSFSPDLIVLDVNMPVMNGIEFYQKILANHGLARYPVLMMTTRVNLESTFRSIDVAGFLPKPFELNTFLQEVNAILAGKNLPVIFVLRGKNDESLIKIKGVLDTEGYKVIVAHHPEQLQSEAETNVPRCILIDYEQSGMAGSEAVKFMKGSSLLQDAPVLVYTKIDNAEYKEKSLQAGADKFLALSNGTQEFLRTVRELEFRYKKV